MAVHFQITMINTSRIKYNFNKHAGGASLNVRKAAGVQICRIISSHPAQFPSITFRIAHILHHKEWDARVAAGHCLGLVAEHFVHTSVANVSAAAGLDAAAVEDLVIHKDESEAAEHRFKLDEFSMETVMSQGAPLLASGGEVREPCMAPLLFRRHQPASLSVFPLSIMAGIR
jgi:hypothetical protein